jgi:hypothetical protein
MAKADSHHTTNLGLARQAAASAAVSSLHAIESMVLPILDLDPVPRPAALIWPVPALRYQPLQPHLAGGAE